MLTSLWLGGPATSPLPGCQLYPFHSFPPEERISCKRGLSYTVGLHKQFLNGLSNWCLSPDSPESKAWDKVFWAGSLYVGRTCKPRYRSEGRRGMGSSSPLFQQTRLHPMAFSEDHSAMWLWTVLPRGSRGCIYPLASVPYWSNLTS